MKSLVLEGTHPLTKSEVKDWLYRVGVIAYVVHPLAEGDPASSKGHRFLITISDSAAQHALTRLAGQKIGQSVITVGIDLEN